MSDDDHDGLMPLQPDDEFNRRLQQNVHPSSWLNPTPRKPYHLVVIGAGTAGLVTAAGAASLGARVAIVERELMGGDCLNVGCVPSKAIISASRYAALMATSDQWGVHIDHPTHIDFSSVMQRMRRLRAQISPADSAARFNKMGVDVFFGQGSFTGDDRITVTDGGGGERELPFRKAVIATGARAAVPPIPGLDRVDYLTNESLFSLTELPPSLGVIGSGPIGSEMAQAFARLGSEVVLFERGPRIMSREDPQAAEILQRQFNHDGVNLMLDSQDMNVAKADGDRIRVSVNRKGTRHETTVDQLLVAVGRAPNVDGMNLQRVGVQIDQNGVSVNDHLQTSNPRIYAAGDICSPMQFTHAADFQARIVIQNALFAIGPLGKKKASDLVVPRATYTSPEIAHVGIDEQDALSQGIKIDTYVQSFADVDRAILDGHNEGFVKVHTRQGTDEILGATIVAENAGDLICEITLAMTHRLGLSKIGSTIHPYPTIADAIRKLGDQYNRTKLTPRNTKLLRWLQRFNVGR